MNLLSYKSEKHVLNTCQSVLNHYKINYTIHSLRESLENHIDYPSLLAVKDILGNYGIRSSAIRKQDYEYSDFETPFISIIQRPTWGSQAFSLILESTDQEIKYLDPFLNKYIKSSVTDFENIDKGIVLLLDEEQKTDEANFEINKKEESKKKVINKLPVLFFMRL